MLEKKIIILIPIAILIFLIIGVIIYFSIFKESTEESPVLEEKTLEKKLQALTAPTGESPEVSEEVIKKLTAPIGGEERVSEDILRKLTAPLK